MSAGADSLATIWEDSTETEQAEKNEALVKSVQSEQDFTNYLALKDYRRAIQLALAMSQPGRLLSLFTAISASHVSGTFTGSAEVDQIIKTLSGIDLVRLLRFVRDWNSNARTSPVAQTVLHAVLRLKTPDDLIAAFESSQKVPVVDVAETVDGEEGAPKKNKGEVVIGMRELLDGLMPYSERHFARIDKLVQDSYMLDYVVGEMDGGLFGSEAMDLDHSEEVPEINGVNGL